MSDSDEALDLFQEPDGFYKPEPEPTQVVHRMLDGRDLSLRLVGHNPLWVGSIFKHFMSTTRNYYSHQIRCLLSMTGKRGLSLPL